VTQDCVKHAGNAASVHNTCLFTLLFTKNI